MTTIAERLATVRERIARAAESAERSSSEITLVAVSKKHEPSAVREAYEAGQRAFGENYAQELDTKAAALTDLSDIDWHFIGHLQSNKAKVVAKWARVVHSVDSESLARELGRRAATNGRKIEALIEVNIGGEALKHGAAASEIEAVARAIEQESMLRLRGLMTMPPADDLEAARKIFDTLKSLRSLHGGPKVLPDLSMGMSDDLEVAIACGATIVRVGTAIFGPRTS